MTKLTLWFPDRIPPGDEDRILCNQFFYGMKNELKSSVRHLFDLSDVTFNLLLTAARKNELEDLDTKVKVHSKAQVSGESSTSPKTAALKHLQEQLNDITTVMKLGNFPKRSNPPSMNSGNTNSKRDGEKNKKQKNIRDNLRGPDANASGPFPPGSRPIQCFKCKGWGHVKRLCPSHLNYTRGECQSTKNSLPKVRSNRNDKYRPRTDSIITKAMKLADRYYNPDPLIRLIGPANESEILIENKPVKALIDSGAQFSGISLKLAKQLKLLIQQLDHLLDNEGSGGIEVPYYGYVEARLKIPEIEGMDEDSLFLVMSDSNYMEGFPISLGTLNIMRYLRVISR